MERRRAWMVAGSLLLLLVGWWVGVVGPRQGLRLLPLTSNGLPLLYMAPAQGEALPGVVVAHGFAGSKQLMLGYALTLARAGYAVMLLDFDGHGANPTPLQREALQRNLAQATAALLARPEVDGTRVALLGHSMGSGAVMEAALREPTRYAATIAISPTDAAVTPRAPRALLLQAGAWEPRFVANAERLLAAAGGAQGASGTPDARAFVLVPAAEHISILFRPASHHAALAWLAGAFERAPTVAPYHDRRLWGYGLNIAGCLGLLVACTAGGSPRPRVAPLARRVAGLGAAPVVAGALLWALSGALELATLGGLLVGGAVALWLAAAGGTWLLVQGRVPRPSGRSLLRALTLFALLSLALGAMGQQLWLQWWPVGRRVALIVPLALGVLPWMLAAAQAQQGARGRALVGWWLAQSVALLGGLLALLLLLPSLGFLVLLLPIWPLLAALFAFAAARLDDVWGSAVGSALFFGWLLAVVFPLAA